MQIIYGKGNVLFNGSARSFDLQYTGKMVITKSLDSMLISATKKRIIGIMLNAEELPEELFSYKGTFKIQQCKVATNNSIEPVKITTQGIDLYNVDKSKWEDDGSAWDAENYGYTVGNVKSSKNTSIAVNNNIKTKNDGDYEFEDGTPVPANTLIHIHSDGKTMTGGVHDEDSEDIFIPKEKRKLIKRKITQIAKMQKTRSSQTTYSDGGGGSGGGGGY